MSDSITTLTRPELPPDPVAREALFASDVQFSRLPDALEIAKAIHDTLISLGLRGCQERVAQEFGDHPELAVERMRRASAAVAVRLGP